MAWKRKKTMCMYKTTKAFTRTVEKGTRQKPEKPTWTCSLLEMKSYNSDLCQIAFHADAKSYPVKYELHLSNKWLSCLEIVAAQLRSVTEISPK